MERRACDFAMHADVVERIWLRDRRVQGMVRMAKKRRTAATDARGAPARAWERRKLQQREVANWRKLTIAMQKRVGTCCEAIAAVDRRIDWSELIDNADDGARQISGIDRRAGDAQG